MNEDLDDTVVGPPTSLPRVEVPVKSALGGPDLDHTVIGPARQVQETNFVDEPAPETKRQGFYSLRLGWSDGAIPLDVPCIIGRRPSLPRIQSGVTPRLIRVPSQLKEVSSSHLEVRQLGASVIVTDLKSVNGTVVLVPGSVPRKLRQGESLVVSPGTLVDIGDNNILQILPMQRPASRVERQL